MLGENGTEQFSVVTRVDGKVVGEQLVHDPFISNTTVIGISRWDLFKSLFKKQFEIKVCVSVAGSFGVQRAIMRLDPVALTEETKMIMEERRMSRELSAMGPQHNYCASS
jgi:hypothetical protein